MERRASSASNRAIAILAATAVSIGLFGAVAHADQPELPDPAAQVETLPVPTLPVPTIPTVAVGLPPVPPATVVVEVGLPPVPPTTVVVAVGLPPMPPDTVVVETGLPPVPPTTVVVAVGLPPVPLTTTPKNTPPSTPKNTPPATPGGDVHAVAEAPVVELARTASNAATAVIASVVTRVGELLDAISQRYM